MTQSTRNLLIINDSPDDHRLFARILTQRAEGHYRTICATGAEDGLAQSRKQVFDCILVDINLPGRSGPDLLLDLIQRPLEDRSAVVIVTETGHEGAVVEALQSGAEDCLPKRDLTADILTRTIDRAIEKHAFQVRLECELRASAEMNRKLQLEVEERKKAELDAAAAKQQAERANESKTAFLTNVSHEIRTPMNGILGMTSLLLTTELTEEQRHFAAAIGHSATGLLCLLNDILDISKLESGGLELENIEFDLGKKIDDTVAMIAVRAVEKDLELGVLVEPNAMGRYYGDPTRLRQILLNLIGNAVKFTKNGSVTVHASERVSVGGNPDSATLQVDVVDTGIGISDEAISRLFLKFNQADNSIARRFGGTGLGLAISRELAELMGGTIEVTSTLGVGSTFRFVVTLPRATSPRPAPQPIQPLAGRRVLVVAALDVSRRILRCQLDHVGVEVTEACDSVATFAALRAASASGRHYDALIIDGAVPGISGNKLPKDIEDLTKLSETKIVLMAPLGSARKQNRMQWPRIDAIITKPLSHDAAVACMARLLFPEETPVAEHKDDFLADRDLRASDENRHRILLAEDNVINQQVAAGILKRGGFVVDVVDDGLAATEAVQRTAYDIILMDLQMPHMGGVQATGLIREIPGYAHVPIIAMTAHAMRGTRAECLRAGMDDYVAKPFDPRGFLSVMRRWATVTEAPAEPELLDSEASDHALLDQEHLAALRVTMDSNDFEELIARAPTRLQERLERLESAVSLDDFGAIEREAHKLVGGAGNVGAKALSTLASELEMGAIEKDRARVDALMRAIGEVAPTTLAALRAAP